MEQNSFMKTSSRWISKKKSKFYKTRKFITEFITACNV
jgi:hypothetical protein